MRISEAWSIVKRLSFKEAFGAGWLLLQHPGYVVPTWSATKQTVSLCNVHYPGEHHLHNRTNAIRHALWNVLIIKYCSRGKAIHSRVLNWAKTITDWHERFAVNPDLEREMDLHNNAYGRNVSGELVGKADTEILHILDTRSRDAVQVTDHQQEWKSETMVYIDN